MVMVQVVNLVMKVMDMVQVVNLAAKEVKAVRDVLESLAMKEMVMVQVVNMAAMKMELGQAMKMVAMMETKEAHAQTVVRDVPENL